MVNTADHTFPHSLAVPRSTVGFAWLASPHRCFHPQLNAVAAGFARRGGLSCLQTAKHSPVAACFPSLERHRGSCWNHVNCQGLVSRSASKNRT